MERSSVQAEIPRGPRWRAWLLKGWPILLALAFLWFPFDWLATVWPAFGAPFRDVFHNAYDHLIGHAAFFFIMGMFALTYLTRLRNMPLQYALALVGAALIQETIQAIFRGELPTYTDFNAFTGDALGGALAFGVWLAIGYLLRRRQARASA